MLETAHKDSDIRKIQVISFFIIKSKRVKCQIYDKNSSNQFYHYKKKGEISINDKSFVGHTSTSKIYENNDKVCELCLKSNNKP